MLVDTHAHLDDARFDGDREEAIARAEEAGVAFVVNPGADLASSRKAVEIAEKHACVYAAVGVHPHDARALDDAALAELRALAAHPKVVAIGEIGLDYFRNLSPRDVQRSAFRRQLDLAVELKKPVILHSRDAHDDMETMLREWAKGASVRGDLPRAPVRGVLHCFSGDVAWAQRAVAMGLCLGFDGPLTYANSTTLREVASAIPVERALIETDSPYLPPLPKKRSDRTEPADARLVAAKLAEIRRLSYADVCRVTGLSAARLFGIPSADERAKIAYVIRNSIYLNITNRCSNRCTFCIRASSEYVKGHRLALDREPSVDDITAALGDVSPYDEVVFCGYGEPTERLDVVKEVARWVKSRGKPVRLVTNGEGDLINGRSIASELAGLVDRVSVSVNTTDPAQFDALCRSEFGPAAHPAALKFVESCRGVIPDIEITAVGAPGVDMQAVEALARKMGVKFRARQYNEVG
jgi:TatD DNase family protein